jgi:hypothetical protein
MSEMKNDNESESSELFNEDEKEKNENIISSSSDEENNNQIQTTLNKSKPISNNDTENIKMLGNKRLPEKDQKQKNDYNNDSRKKIKKYSNNNYSNDKKTFQPSLDIPLVTYDLFCQLFKEKGGDKNLTDEEYKKMYEEYKLNHEQKNNEQFFNHHKEDEWFLEKYQPYKYTLFNQKERGEMCQRKAKIFFDSYNIDNLINKKEIIDIKEDNNNNNLTQNFNYIFDLKEEHEYNKNIKILYTKINVKENKIEEVERDLNNIPLNKDLIQKELEEDGKPYYFFNPDYLTLYNLTSLTKNIDIISVINLFKKYPGFISLSLTEPERINGYKRSFWVTYDNETNYQNVLNNIKDYELKDEFLIKLIKSETTQNLLYKKIKITPPLFEDRLDEDIQGTKKIINILDTYREIANNPLLEKLDITELSDLKNEEKVNILNLNILYLRKIHGFCYYCLKGFKDERNLTKKCDFLHLRHYLKLGKRGEVANININDLNISEDELKNAIEFDKLFNEKLNELLNDKEKINKILLLRPKYLMNDELALERMEEERRDFIKKNSEQLDVEKFECKVCKKKFIAFNYIENHMKNKHSEKMNDYAEANVNEFLMKENFKEDKEKFSKSNIISNMEDYEDYLNNRFDGSKNGNYNNSSTYEHIYHKKYKDWDDPINFQSTKNPYMKISYDDL